MMKSKKSNANLSETLVVLRQMANQRLAAQWQEHRRIWSVIGGCRFAANDLDAERQEILDHPNEQKAYEIEVSDECVTQATEVYWEMHYESENRLKIFSSLLQRAMEIEAFYDSIQQSLSEFPVKDRRRKAQFFHSTLKNIEKQVLELEREVRRMITLPEKLSETEFLELVRGPEDREKGG
jgi:hypothetical protein